jgi:hypothetical protein
VSRRCRYFVVDLTVGEPFGEQLLGSGPGFAASGFVVATSTKPQPPMPFPYYIIAIFCSRHPDALGRLDSTVLPAIPNG